MPQNWNHYNSALNQRANIFKYIPKNAEQIWYNKDLSGGPGASKTYSDRAIEICLTIKEVLRLPFRQTEGTLNAIFVETKKDLRCPDYSTLSRRSQMLVPRQIRYIPKNQPICLSVDSSGLKTKGDGEWHRKNHDPCSHREWEKIHAALDCNSRQFLDFELTSSKVTDDQVLPRFIKNAPSNTTDFVGDGAYDKRNCYAAALNRKINPIIPPRYDAIEHPNDPVLFVRNKVIQATRSDPINKREWKKATGYHRRSLSENGFFRLKKIFGHDLQNRKPKGQRVQVALRINLLNIFMHEAK